MAVTAETRQDIIELVVTAFNAAPGASLLTELIAIFEEQGSLEAVAEAIVNSDEFSDLYPSFLTLEEFAEQWLGRLVPEAPEAARAGAQELAVSLINGGTTPAQIVIQAAAYLSAGVGPSEFSSSFANFANKVAVATAHTVEARLDGTITELQLVLTGVTSDPATVEAAENRFTEALNDGETFVLTDGIDTLVGTDRDDTFTSEDALDPFDSIDGGGGTDQILILDTISIDLGSEEVRNVENVLLRTIGGIDVDLTEWEGVEHVNLGRFGVDDNVKVIVDDATVESRRTFGGDVTIVGAAGEVDIAADEASAVHIGSAGHTERVTVVGGAFVEVNSGLDRKQSETVTHVSVHDIELMEVPSIEIKSNAIESVELHTTDATALVINDSRGAGGAPLPTSLTLTVNDYDGKLCIGGASAAETVRLNVATDSNFTLSSDRVKTLDITANADLTLRASNFFTDPGQEGGSPALESLIIRGDGDVSLPTLADEMDALQRINARASTGDNLFKSAGVLNSLAEIMGGSGADRIELMGTNLATIHTHGGNDNVHITGGHRNDGLRVDLGAGEDTFKGDNGGNNNSRIDGGEGRDTLILTAGPASYRDGDTDRSIFSNFEVLDVGGGSGNFDIALIGVDTVLVRGGTSGEVTLSNMADGMGFAVHGNKGLDTNATIIHDMPPVTRARYSGELDISLLAIGGDGDFVIVEDLDNVNRTGEVTLKLTVDEEIEILDVDSSAIVGGTLDSVPADQRPGTADYRNVLELDDAGTVDIEDIYVSGDAMLEIEYSSALNGTRRALELIDGTENSGGVIFDGSVSLFPSTTDVLELIGGSGDDTLTGTRTGTNNIRGNHGNDTLTGGGNDDEISGGAGADTLSGEGGDDEITGGAGGDTLIGGAGDDKFIITAVSDSQLSFVDGKAVGMDTFGVERETASQFKGPNSMNGADKIVLPRSLFNSLQGEIKDFEYINENTDVEGDGSDWSVFGDLTETFINENAEGFFETRETVTDGFAGGGNISQHSVAVIHQDADSDGNSVGTRDYTWIFIDIDGDGDLNLATDHVIRLAGNIDIAATDFEAG